MDDGFMEYIDAQYKLLVPEGRYVTDIFDQEKVNAMWAEYQSLSENS
ncbi:hypothetical protein [Chryseobacterium sp. P1-3]|nr:hypothetical protein [Chryseobacterium sp. P1-3]